MQINKDNIIYYWDGPMSVERKKILDDALYSARLYNPTRPIYLVSNSIKQEQLEEKYNIIVETWDNSIYEPLSSLSNIEEIQNIYNNAGHRDRSDLFRLLLLYKYGGTYVDTDDVSLRPLPKHHILSNSFCASYDPHTAGYSKVAPEDCVPGKYREVEGYDHLNMYPRNDCWVNFEPEHYMIKEIIFDERFTSRNNQVDICDEFSWQRLTLETIKKNISNIGKTFNYTLNLMYVYESHVAYSSHWDMCIEKGPICDIWPIKWGNENWGKYTTNESEALSVLDNMKEVYKFGCFLWLHDKCGNPEWQIDNLDASKNYLISTHILNKLRNDYRKIN